MQTIVLVVKLPVMKRLFSTFKYTVSVIVTAGNKLIYYSI